MFLTIFWRGDLRSARGFYESCGYDSPIDDTDRVLVARDGFGQIVAAVRLCHEEEYLVLRGVLVREDCQRQGIGSKLLKEAEGFMKTQACHCLPFCHLVKFYEKFGFREVDEHEVPTHLQDRLKEYRQNPEEEKYTVMIRNP
jgi:N-acetylglutamate synthase-like GNAT family acetyltransferase